MIRAEGNLNGLPCAAHLSVSKLTTSLDTRYNLEPSALKERAKIAFSNVGNDLTILAVAASQIRVTPSRSPLAINVPFGFQASASTLSS